MPAIVELKLDKADDSVRSSDSVSGEKQSQNSGMPVPINRPPSTTTVTSTTSATGGAQRTTTSRRGGRTRSRSPVVMGNRLPGPGEIMPPAGGDNPSSAAAAAAAAAKAFSSSGVGRNPNTWSEAGVREDPGFPTGYDKHYSGSSNWPGEEGHGAHAYGPAHRYQGGNYGDEYQQEGGRHYGHGRPDEPPPGYHDRRYREPSRGPAYDEGAQPPHPNHYPPDFRYTNQSRDTRNNPKIQRGGGTSLVIGTSKPIHVPKTPGGGGGGGGVGGGGGPPQRKSRQGSTLASVFRGRPGSDSDRAAAPKEEDDDSPQKILLSLRTPTTSFEDTGRGKKTSGLPLSPDDPPRIQNSHHQRPTDQLFEQQRSSDGLKNVGSIEMAPSFNLFNQSFDSFGDTQYFNVDSTLQNDSFGIVRTGSVENEGAAQMLQTTASSGGNFAQQMLTATGSGALTIGYSPVNSFGTVLASAAPPRRSGNMMVLGGGSDLRGASPTQELGMYPSYSGSGAPRSGPSGPLDDSHLRMSVGSFGGPMSYGRPPYSDPSSSPYYCYNAGPSRSHESSERSPSFYAHLRKYKAAFKDCTFLLPGLKAALLEPPISGKGDTGDSKLGTDEEGQHGQPWDSSVKSMPSQPPYMGSGGHARYANPSLHDIKVARRRIECSVCTFGGNLDRDRSSSQASKLSGSPASVKRENEGQPSATVTPSSSVGTPPGSRLQSRAKMKYEEALPGRYYENESRLSWEFEETPPIEIGPDDEDEKNDDQKDDMDSKDGKSNNDGSYCKPTDGDYSGKRLATASPQPKMRYRCKLCGQPKQNHNCPYQQSLARSIGINVYPAVNAFSAAEPGTIAPALSEMNNFIDQKEINSSNESSPSRPTPERNRRVQQTGSVKGSTQVTPESMRSSPLLNSPGSFTPGTPARTPRSRNGMGRRGNKKRAYSQLNGGSDDQGDLLFIESMELKSEQFRIVTPSKALKSPDAFTYPALPLPYAQRKRLSDNIFSLSNEVPKLTDECAQVLREAREKGMWDLAVAELMTQVVVIIHCPDGDHKFEGLRQYLLTLGVAC